MKKNWIILLLLIIGWQIGYGQNAGFRKIYKAGTYGCQFMAAAPVGDGLLTAAYALDSTDSLHTGVKLLRIDSKGVVQAAHFYSFDTSYWVGTLEKSLTKIDANRYAFVTWALKVGNAWRYYVGVCDSNGQLVRSALKKVDLCAADSFGAPGGLIYDHSGHLLVYGNIQCAPKSRMLLIKLDTLLNVVWERAYTPDVIWYTRCKGVLSDSAGYTLFGGTRLGSGSSPTYSSRSVMIRVDTGGVQQWQYESDQSKVYSEIGDAAATADGGYVYLATGPALNKYLGYPTAYWAGKGALVKLNAARQVEWEVSYGNWYSGVNPDDWARKVFVYPDGNILIVGGWSDSIGVNQWNGYIRYRKYSGAGQFLWEHSYAACTTPTAGDDTSFIVFDGCMMPDGGVMMVGNYTDNNGSSNEGMYGFLMRTDSNGCIDPNGPECWPLAVPEPPQPSSAVSYTLYPNPATNIAVLSRSVQEQTAEVRFTDVSGRAIASYTMAAGVGSIELDVSQWSRGVYLYHIYEGNQLQHSGRLVK